ncbi:MAG: hypothetical protein JXM70_04080 [Pirellulales bacterium]|nr:hypothetical protein [Pirellulales bacterium]
MHIAIAMFGGVPYNPATMRGLGNKNTIYLILLGLLALGLRVGVVFVLWGDHAGSIGYEHDEIARNLLAGDGFSVEFLGSEGPTSQQAPFYPLLLAAVYGCLGAGTSASILAMQLLQCVVGTAIVLAVVWLCWSLLPETRLVGWVAGLGAAVYPTHLYMVTHLQVAIWAALLLTLLLAVVVSPRWRATRGGAVLAGVLAGLLLLVEPILALALPIAVVVFWTAEAKRFGRAAFANAALMAGVAAILISPWLVRNRIVHGEFVFVKSTFGYAFWQANNHLSWGTDKIPKPESENIRNAHDNTPADMNRALWEARHEAIYIDNLLLTPADRIRLSQLSEPQRSRDLGRKAWSFIRENPGRYASLCLQRLRYFLLFDETNPKAANRLYRAGTVAWLTLGFVGLLVSWPQWRRLWSTYAIVGLVTLFHTLVITAVRFRIPIEPITFVWASLAVSPAIARIFQPSGIKIYRPGELSRDPFDSRHVLKGPHFQKAKKSSTHKSHRRRAS